MDAEQLDRAVADLAHTIGKLARRVRTAAAASGLPFTQRVVLARLANDGPASVSDLARAESMKPQSMGATVATLEAMGLVERQPHPTDGRRANLVLTEQGVALREQARAAKLTWLAQAVAQLDEQERETLFAAGEIIKRLVET